MPDPFLFRDRERRRGRGRRGREDARGRRPGLINRIRNRIADALDRGADNLGRRAAANRARRNR